MIINWTSGGIYYGLWPVWTYHSSAMVAPVIGAATTGWGFTAFRHNHGHVAFKHNHGHVAFDSQS